jgi:predicted RNase H-like HicB family nuclease
MEIPVLIEPVAGNGYRATGASPFTFAAEGATREEALGKLQKMIESKLEAGSQVTRLRIKSEDNPWLAMAGIWEKDDPLVKEWKQTMEENRQREGNEQEHP